MNNPNLSKLMGKPAILTVVGLVILIFIIMLFSARSTRASYQSDLQSQFEASYASLGNCETKITEAMNITASQAKQFRKNIQLAAAAAATTGGVAGISKSSMRGSLVPILAVIYPDQTQVNQAFERLYSTAIGCRDDFFGEQKLTIKKAADYNNWINGSFKSAVAGIFMSFPSDALEFQLGNNTTVKGKAALRMALRPLSTATATTEFQTGTLKPTITTSTIGG